MDKLKIKKKYIGSKVFQPVLRQWLLIVLGEEEKYEKLGMDIFTKRRTPKLQKNESSKLSNGKTREDVKNTIKKLQSDDKATKKRNVNDDSDSNGTDNDSNA